MELVEERPHRFRIERHGDMRVPGVVFASRELLADAEQSLQQVVNVATLPGIVGASYAMPDIHWGYGFPIGGVAATAVEEGGVVSPGGVGFDISCGVRLLAAGCERKEFERSLPAVMDALDRTIPRGAGPGGVWRLAGPEQMERILRGGSRYAVEQGHGEERDLVRCEDRGAVAEADVTQVG
ncbi:RtcB family protein, partial [Streptomyces spiralis]